MNIVKSFSSFSTDDLAKAEEFYGQTLGLTVSQEKEMGLLNVKLPGGGEVMIYPKDDHQAATFTVLNLIVDNLEGAVDELTGKGVSFEQYDNEYMKTNEKGIAKDEHGPAIAWFKDPAGNILALIENDQ